jgi:hypothetical protein
MQIFEKCQTARRELLRVDLRGWFLNGDPFLC